MRTVEKFLRTRNIAICAFVIVTTLSITIPTRCSGEPLKIDDVISSTAIIHQIDPDLILALSIIESRNDDSSGWTSPWPWTLNINGVGVHYNSYDDAAMALIEALEKGITNIDIGPMQVNLKEHGHRVDDPIDLLNIETNFYTGATILKEALISSPDNVIVGLGRYHSWTPKKSKRFGLRLYKTWKNIQLYKQGEKMAKVATHDQLFKHVD